jgi:UDP-N-acetylmuramoylalanine--D-glutamate ligase
MRHEGIDSFICSVEQVPLVGKHNLSNVLAATAIVATADLPLEAIGPAIERFEGVPHRLEFVRTIAGVDWYNDSIATTPDRALAAIHAFSRPLVLIAGGRDKDLNWSNFAVEVLQGVEHLILFGEAAEKIESAVKNVLDEGEFLQMRRCERMEDAVGIAKDVAEAGDVVVLSPGATSFDAFPDYEARGDKFRDLVRAM